MDLREIGWDGVDWVDLAQDSDHWRALVNTVMILRVPVIRIRLYNQLYTKIYELIYIIILVS
jgi:hypothetical protein